MENFPTCAGIKQFVQGSCLYQYMYCSLPLNSVLSVFKSSSCRYAVMFPQHSRTEGFLPG